MQLKDHVRFVNGNLEYTEPETLGETRGLFVEAYKDGEYKAENFVCSMIENYRDDFEIEIDGYHFSVGGGYDVSVNDVATDVYDWETEDWEQTSRREAEDESLFAEDEDEVNGNNNENPDDDEDDYYRVATKFYKDSSLPPGCRIVHKLRCGKLTVFYRSGDGKMFSKRENLLANVNNEAVISPASETLLSNIRTPAANIINSIFNNNHDKTLDDDVDNENTSEGSIQEFFGFEPERMESNSSSVQPPECSTPVIPITPIAPIIPITPMFKQLEDLADEVAPSTAATSGSEVAKCQPCNLEFPAADIPIHLAQTHGGEKAGTKPRSCTICRNNVLMKVHVLQKHRKDQHPNNVTHNKGRPKKDPSTPVNMSTPKSQSKAGKVSTPRSIPSKAKVEEDVFNNETLNSSAEDIEKIGDFLSKTAPVPATKSKSKRGPNKTKNKGPNPVGGATPKKKSRSRSLGGEKVLSRKVAKSPKVTPKGKSGPKKLAPVLSDNDPKHPTSSVNLRRKGRHSHDSSMECAMNCALAPCPELPRAEGRQLDADTVIRDLGEAGRAGQEEDAIMSIHSQM